MGCAECKLLRSLKFHRHIESLIGIDINESLLQSNQNSLQPLITDYLHRRSRPLKIQLFKGNVIGGREREGKIKIYSFKPLQKCNLQPFYSYSMHLY